MKENARIEKSFLFAVYIIKLYRYRIKIKKETIIVDGKGFDVIVNVRVDVPGSTYSAKEEFVYSILFKDNKTVATSVVSPARSKVLRQNDVATNSIIDQDIDNVNNVLQDGIDNIVTLHD